MWGVKEDMVRNTEESNRKLSLVILKADDVKEMLDEIWDEVQCSVTIGTSEINLNEVGLIMSDTMTRWYYDLAKKIEKA